MSKRPYVTIDGNEAAAYIAHKVNEVIAIYPITPSSPMGEWADQWTAEDKTNIWGTVPLVVEMQSEGGAAGAVHGALQTGSLTTTFTASQGLLLMVPNMFKIAGELTPTVFHVAARSVAAQALSIFGDHSDVMATRQTGWGMLCSNSVQEVMDFALIAQAATLKARVPFIHFFDGFRTSHEVAKIEQLTDDDIRAMIDDDLVIAHRARGLSPDTPFIRGTAQNPDVFFQARETVNIFYQKTPAIVQEAMDTFAGLTGRHYHLFDYVGAPDADRVIVMMGSGAETAHQTVEHLVEQGEKVGLVKVRLYRPFDAEAFLASLPATTTKVAVLDRTKEPGGSGEPLYLDCITAMVEGERSGLKIVGGRYGLSSKEFTPGMVKGIFDELAKPQPKNHFTVGINDDVTFTSIDYDPGFSIESPKVVRALFYGLGADGTVGANKNSIKIIGEDTPNYAQGHFVYDSKKSGATTVSHLRFGPTEIRQPYLITSANFIAVHQTIFLERYDVLAQAAPGSVFLLNTYVNKDEVWDSLPRVYQEHLIRKNMKFYVIDAYDVADKTNMGGRINTIMQTCFFAISGVLPEDEAIAAIKQAIKKTYGKRGEKVIQQNYEAVDQTLAHLFRVPVPADVSSTVELPSMVPAQAPDFVQKVTAEIMAGRGDDLPVSLLPIDGTYPSATTQWEKRNIALEIPIWDPDVCIQCGKCALVCPHATIRIKAYPEEELAGAPESFRSMPYKGKEYPGWMYTIQVAAEDCTGCGACVHVCPAKNKREPRFKAINMEPQPPIRDRERENYDFFLSIPEIDRRNVNTRQVKTNQLLQPLFEYSGACAGCGETPYIKLITQLFGDRTIVANATGCSSIYGGNLPTTPYAVNSDGRGPAWSNSLFEDNAEFGLGMRLTLDKRLEYAIELLKQNAELIGLELVDGLLTADQSDETGIYDQRQRVAALKQRLASLNGAAGLKQLASLADILVKKTVWIFGGDGWAYDIGYGGLDHVLASGRNINVLVMDTEVYSNTGGQMSKATPRAAVAKFAAAGKPLPKKDLAMIAMSYGNIYVARIAMGASDAQTVRAILDAESYDGPSLILAYSHCIAHGINMTTANDQQKKAVDSGHWPLLRYDPRLVANGKNPLQLDSRAPKMPLRDYVYNETRYTMLTKTKPQHAAELLTLAQEDVTSRWHLYEQMATLDYSDES
ncbi:MAG: pyruvate:ferredoxin (flavodoxin) oxidoreductase [Anaerolineales bacterium]|nr:pyruvate:ferredoxin (flavodoxin) oxidoreductase [Anaerolineales bacterium]